MNQLVKTKCNQFLLQKINEDIAEEIHMDLCLNFDTKIKELNKRLMKLYKIRNYQLFCYEPIHKVDNFDAAFEDDFLGWDLAFKENKNTELISLGLVSANELIFTETEPFQN